MWYLVAGIVIAIVFFAAGVLVGRRHPKQVEDLVNVVNDIQGKS